MKYLVITENDVSKWKDKTGEEYHFPNRYLKYFQPGTQVVYYKGTMTDKQYLSKRLSPHPHYFGIANIGQVFKDEESDKNDYLIIAVSIKVFLLKLTIRQLKSCLIAG